jgi:hypothetical protein
MKPSTSNRQLLSWMILFFYLIPFLFFASYSIGLMSRSKSWLVLSSGLLLIAMCSLILILTLFYWEKAIRNQLQGAERNIVKNTSNEEKEPKVTSLDLNHDYDVEPPLSEYEATSKTSQELNLLEALNESQMQNSKLMEDIEHLNDSLQQLNEEHRVSMLQGEKATQDLEEYKLFSEEQLKQKNLQIVNLQQMMDDQRSEMEKRQDQIQLLDTKVHDLSYEIKTLLHLNDIELEPAINNVSTINLDVPPRQIFHDLNEELEASASSSFPAANSLEAEVKYDHPIKTAAEANGLLKKCLNSAQKLTGANYNSPEALRYREFSSSHYTIDQRRLFDSLRSEVGGLVIVYSPKDNKVLFANQVTKTLLGWSPEKFSSDFALIIQEGMTYWKKALSLLTTTPESQARLLAKTKQGQEILLNCHLGVVPTGLFRGYIIGVLYPA